MKLFTIRASNCIEQLIDQAFQSLFSCEDAGDWKPLTFLKIDQEKEVLVIYLLYLKTASVRKPSIYLR